MLRFLILVLSSVTFCVSDPTVIIVGAGPSGIAAATRLLKNGITNITVLEAENRIGGRIYSVPFGKGYVDLGAEWCHGMKNNVVYEMMKDLDVLRLQHHVTSNKVSHSKYKVLEQSFAENLTEILDELFGNPHEVPGSIGEYLSESYKEKISWWETDPKNYAISKDAINLLEAYVNSLEGSFSWFDISGTTDFDGRDTNEFIWNGFGYKTIIEVIMQKYPDPSKALPIDDKILLNKEVVQISWDSDKTIVKCADGSSYSADYVIVTVSLGVLKHQHDTLFAPKLPADKVNAIEHIGFGGVHKVFLHFGDSWWNDTSNVFTFVWDNEDKTQLIKDGKSWITGMSIITGVQNNPNLLSAWVTGPFVPDVERCSDETVIDGVMHLLEYFNVVDAKTITRPDKIVRSKWCTNPHFRGTYSYQKTSTRLGANSDETILAAPLGNDLKKPNLLFAGEASSPTHFSTVHGAIESGFREADRIIKMHK